MSTPDTTPETPTTDPAAEAQQGTPETPETGAPDPADERGNPNREAATRRRQLREVEAERDALRARVDGYERADVDRIAAEEMVNPADLWLATSLDEMRDESGAVDPGLARSVVEKVLKDRPYWRKGPARIDMHQGPRGDPHEDQAPSFGAAIRKAARR